MGLDQVGQPVETLCQKGALPVGAIGASQCCATRQHDMLGAKGPRFPVAPVGLIASAGEAGAATMAFAFSASNVIWPKSSIWPRLLDGITDLATRVNSAPRYRAIRPGSMA